MDLHEGCRAHRRQGNTAPYTDGRQTESNGLRRRPADPIALYLAARRARCQRVRHRRRVSQAEDHRTLR